MLTFPTHLFNPIRTALRPASNVVEGGETLSGETDVIQTDGGGYWVLQLMGIELTTPDLVRAWRAWQDELGGGTVQVLVPVVDIRHAPRPVIAGRPARPSQLAATSTDPYFPEAVGFATPLIVARITAPAALRATQLTIEVQRGARLRGGEVFAIAHPGVGRRVYRTGRVISRDGANPQIATVKIKTPLREAVLANTAVDFDWPSMVATQIVDSDPTPELSSTGFGTVDIAFREAF